MSYEAFALLVEKHRDSLARLTVNELYAKKGIAYDSPAHQTEIKGYTRGIGFGIDQIIQYIRTSDVEGWVSVVKRISQQRLQEGHTVLELLDVTDTLVAKIEEMLELELPGPKNAEARQNYRSRLQGIKAVTRATQQSSAYKSR